MPISISLVRGSPTPAYRQILDQVATAAATGRLVEGETLPTVRALAETLELNPNTVARAFTELSRSGVIESRGNRGMFVAPRRQMYTGSERRRRMEPTLDTFVSGALLLGFDLAEIRELVEEKRKGLSRKRTR